MNHPEAAEPAPESLGVQSSLEALVRSSFLAFRAGKRSRVPDPSHSPHRQRCGRAGWKRPCSSREAALGHAPAPSNAGVAPSSGSGQASTDAAPQQRWDPGWGFALALGQCRPPARRGPHPTPGGRREGAL